MCWAMVRRTGARDVIDKNEKMVLVGEFENQDKAEEAYNVTQNLITSNPDLKVSMSLPVVLLEQPKPLRMLD